MVTWNWCPLSLAVDPVSETALRNHKASWARSPGKQMSVLCVVCETEASGVVQNKTHKEHLSDSTQVRIKGKVLQHFLSKRGHFVSIPFFLVHTCLESEVQCWGSRGLNEGHHFRTLLWASDDRWVEQWSGSWEQRGEDRLTQDNSGRQTVIRQ